MEKPSSPSKFLIFLLQFALLSQLLQARILTGDSYDCKRVLASAVDGDDAVLSSSHLNLADDELYRAPSKYAPPSPKPHPSPHPVLGCRPPHRRDGGDGVQMPQPTSSPTGPAPRRDYSRQQQAEAAGRPPSSRPGKMMMDVFRAFLDVYARQM
uniref:Uncharacterized protein n=1 Tax=Avena sativa TaxID=4498 RepID=A0ACD5TE86_AVESA